MNIMQVALALALIALPTLSALSSVSHAAPSADAQLVVAGLQKQKFTCTTTLRCRGKIAGYSLPINIFVSAQFDRARSLGLFYYLHGWFTDASNDPFQVPYGDYAAFLTQADRNVILVIPESRGQNATYANELNTSTKMNKLLDQVEGLLSASGVSANATNTRRLLAGHSGAYVQLGKMGSWIAANLLPRLNSLRAFALFDSAYGYRDGLVTVMDSMCQQPTATYLMAFNPNDGSTGKRDTNQRLFNELKTTHLCPHAQVIYHPDKSLRHMEFPKNYFVEFIRASLDGEK